MKKILSLSCLCSIFLFSFFSCSSSSVEIEESSLSPLALLSEDSSIYINLPVEHHKKLFADILCSQVEGLSEKDALSLASRTANLYAALGNVKDRSHLEAVALVDIPKVGIKSVFKKKNGWLSEEYLSKSDGLSETFTFYKRSDNPIQVSFPEKSLLCVSKNVNYMLDRYAEKKVLADNDMTSFLLQGSEDILFYITRPGQYLRNMIGVTIQGSDRVWGKLKYKEASLNDKKAVDKYEMEFFVHLQYSKTMKAFKGLLALSFAMTGGKVEESEDLTIKVSGVEVSAKQINEMFIRKPITGTHYKVVGDNVYAVPDR